MSINTKLTASICKYNVAAYESNDTPQPCKVYFREIGLTQ